MGARMVNADTKQNPIISELVSQPMPVITNYATEPKGYYGKANLTISQVLYIELKCHYSPTMEGL